MIHNITPEKEEKIKKQKHPHYGQPIPKDAKVYPAKKIFHDTEEINNISQAEQSDYAVILDDGLNSFEGLQNRQDWCIKINVLFGYNAWATPNMQIIDCIERLKKIGYLNAVELRQQLSPADLRWPEIWRILDEMRSFDI